MNAFELERFISRRLSELPSPRAPQTLMPRVLAAAKAWSQRPWYAREWLTWPMGWQIASVALAALTVGGVAMVLPAIQLLALDAAKAVTAGLLPDVPQLRGALNLSLAVGRVLWRAVVQPVLPYAFVLILLMIGTCAAVALALNRLMFGRVLHS